MSRIIKPSDTKLFQSVRRFQKQAFSLVSNEEKSDVVPAESPAKAEAKFEPELKVAGLTSDEPLAAASRTTDELVRKAEQEAESRRLRAEREAEALKCEAEQQAREMLDDAERKARQSIRDAEQEAGGIREKAREEGRAEGREEARERDVEESSRILSSFIEEMKKSRSVLIDALTPKIGDLATELARKIIHREIARDVALAGLQVEHAIGKIIERENLIVRTHPEDEGFMKRHKELLMKKFDGIEKIEVIGDPDVERGGCIVETNLIRVDAQPSKQLDAARRVILDEME